jgi:hypothetical protein
VRVDAATFNDHLGLAKVIALEYTNIPGVTVDEAVSEAHQALLRASSAFDPTKGEFTPFAARSIRNALNSFYAKHLRLAQIFPRSLDELPTGPLLRVPMRAAPDCLEKFQILAKGSRKKSGGGKALKSYPKSLISSHRVNGLWLQG